ncbi:chaperone [Lithospermum erythrorhizon]|uniref:Chaperone n=1 Tax=Lithospermum erythrorhizon TaxID=34254 RepID=A0AAV3RM83_LITER
MQNVTEVLFDTGELKVGMKEKQNGVLSHSDRYCKETNSLSINMKNMQHLNCQGEEKDNSVLPERRGDGFSTTSELEHLEVVDHVIKDMESGDRDLPNGNDLGEVLYNQVGTRSSKTLTFDKKSRDKVLRDPEFKRMMTSNDCAKRDEHTLPDSGAQMITSKLIPADSSLFTDKNVMEYEVPQLIVCCKDIECQHVKDICVDKGEQLEERGLIDKHTDDFAGPHFSKPSGECGLNETTENLDSEFHIPDGTISPAQSGFSNLTADRCEAKEERKCISPLPSESECLRAGQVKENGPTPEASMPASKTNVDNKMEKYVLVEEPLVTTVLPLENFGTRSFLRSFMDSLNSQGDVDSQRRNQSMKADPKSEDAELEPDKSNQNATETTLDFCNEPTVADSRSMNNEEVSEKTWKAEDVPNHNFRNIIDPFASHVVQRSDMVEREQEYSLSNEFRNSSNPFIVSEIQSSGKERSVVDTHHETPPINVERHSRNPFGVEVQSTTIEVSTEESLPATIVNHKENFNPFAFSETESPSLDKDTENIYQVPAESPKRGTNNPFADCEVKSADMDKNCEGIDRQPELSNKIASTNPFAMSEIHSSSKAKIIQCSDQQSELNHNGSSYNPFDNPELEGAGLEKIDGNPITVIVSAQQSFEPRDMHNHDGTPKNVSFRDQSMAGVGETSFSAVSGRITYSGPIAVSGSTSLRSDSSTTSTRSFAFPVLQSEWNSSPVRMERADRRKQRGSWKHGILCCKF